MRASIKTNTSLFLIWMVGLLFPCILQAASPLVLNDKANHFNPSGHISYLEDPDGTLSYQDILKPSTQAQFTLSDKPISLGYSKSAYWFMLPLKNDIPSKVQTTNNEQLLRSGFLDIAPTEIIPDDQWTLEIAYPVIDQLEIFFATEDKPTTHLLLGDHQAFENRPVPLSNFIVPFQLSPNQTGTLFIRVETNSSMRLPITIRSLSDTMNYYKYYQIGYGVYFGIIAASFLYNLFMYMFLRDRSYLYYIACIVSFSFVLGSVMGFGQDYIWRPYQWITDYAIVLSIALYGVFALLFSQSFLHTKRHTPRIHFTMSILIWAGILISIAGLVAPYNIMVRFVAVYSVLHTFLIFITGIIILFKGIKAAKYFVLAWSTVLFGVSMFALLANGLVPANFLTHYSAQFGSAMEVILLSLALADRLRQLELDKTRLEQEARNALKKANDELSIALDKLQKSSRLKDEFLATISHELRTPMNGVEGAIELAKSETSPAKSVEHLEVAANSAKRMTHLVDTILEYSELQADKTRIEKQPVNLTSILTSISQNIDALAKAKGLSYQVEVDQDVAERIEGDSRAISIILAHLLDNAIKFTHRGAIKLRLEIPSTKDNSNAVIAFIVTDSGIGISQEKIQDIFTPFHQLDNSFSRGYGGLGIGLTICQELASKMQGKLSVTNSSKGGAEFTLSLPYRPCNKATTNLVSPPQSNKASETNPVLNFEGKSILIVEDNLVNQKILNAILKRMNVYTTTANDGLEALEALKENDFDLIFMDCQMPNMDGFETTQTIRETPSSHQKVPIVAVTANAMSTDRTRCLESGMNDYIKKPINRSIIEEKLERWLPASN